MEKITAPQVRAMFDRAWELSHAWINRDQR